MKTSLAARSFSRLAIVVAGSVWCGACASSSSSNAAGTGSGGATSGSAGQGAGSTSGSSTSPSGASGSTSGSSNGFTGPGSYPELIVSGPNSYWNTATQVTRVAGVVSSVSADAGGAANVGADAGGAADGSAGAGGPMNLSVDPTTTYQRWDGFGGTFNEMGWDALSGVSSSEISNALTLLFDPNNGANFRYGRLPLGASDYAMSWYTFDDTAGDYSMADFSIARDLQMLVPYIKAAIQVRPDLHLWASPWNPPSWMTEGSGSDVIIKGDAQTQQAYALYMARFVEEYAKQGLTIEAIHPQNEPGYAWAKWPGMLFIDFIKTYLGPTFAQRNLTTQIWCGTMSAPTDGTLATTLASDSVAMQYVKGFGVQWNTQSVVSTLSAKGPVMQTEHKCGNYPFATTYWNASQYNPNKPPNDHAYGEESWKLIRDWITSGVNSYLAWNMVLDTTGKSLSGWPQNALLVVDRTAKTLTATPAYYAFRHFSQYIATGATRIAINGTNDAVAFENPDQSMIAEVYNSGDSSTTATVGVGSVSYRFDVPAHGWATLHVTP